MSSLFVMSFRDAKNLVVVLSKTLFPAEKNYNNGTAFESAQHYLPDSSTARTIRPSFEKKNIFLYDSSSKTTMTPKIAKTIIDVFNILLNGIVQFSSLKPSHRPSMPSQGTLQIHLPVNLCLFENMS